MTHATMVNPDTRTGPAGRATTSVAPRALEHGVTVVLPVFNESRLVARTCEAARVFAESNRGYSFLFVDDGSVDGTGALLSELIAKAGSNALGVLGYPENQGKGHAIKAGVGLARGDYVLFTDGDLAYPLEQLSELVAALEHSDVAIGSRSLCPHAEKNTTLLRRALGGGFNILARLVIGLPHRDTQAGLKGFRIDAARAIFGRQRLTGFAFDVEIVFLARRLGLRVAEIPARVSSEHSYKVSKVSFLRDPLRMFWALVQIRVNAARGRYD